MGFFARFTFDPSRAPARRWRGIDPTRTSARTYPVAHHELVARSAREVLVAYAALDPEFALADPATFADPAAARRAQTLVRYLTHSFRPFELYSASPVADTSVAEVLDTVEDLLEL